MKKSEIVPGGRYATAAGECYEVVDLDSGWRLDRGNWVEDKRYGRRYMGAKKGYVPYQTNPLIRVVVPLDSAGIRVRAVIAPRKLVMTWENWQVKQELARRSAEVAKATRESYLRMFEERGVRVTVDLDREVVEILLADVPALLAP